MVTTADSGYPGYYGLVADTGDRITVAWDPISHRRVYRLNDGPAAPFPAEFDDKDLRFVAFELLRQYVDEKRKPNEEEELTLP